MERPSLETAGTMEARPLRACRPTSGFSLVELLVVVAIIGILIALLLPAVQYAREAARRASCSNNLRQIGLALANYDAGHGVFPSGYIGIWHVDVQADLGPGWGWATMLLPFMEQDEIYRSLNADLAIEAHANGTGRVRLVASYFCPSDDMPRLWTPTSIFTFPLPRGIETIETPVCDVAGANYVGVYGTGEPGPDGDGVFFRNSSVKARDVHDGLAGTMAVGERSHNLNFGRGNATWVGSVAPALLYSTVGGDPDMPGSTRVYEDACGMTLGHTGEGRGPGDAAADVNQFLSRHGWGAQFLFCDGHVRFISGSIDYRLYKALSTRAGKEPVAADAF
jgi:prepilin-type N-terminal cleavage/methylation domain-containing protein/prepilin-type processing-associated H-X9-DG protein